MYQLKISHLLRYFLLKAFVLIFCMLGSASAAEPPKTMIVLDSSGSMWGQINGKAKIEIARETIKNLLQKWDPKIHLGLSAYGHRKKGDCQDIQTLKPVSPVDKDSILQAVNTLQPKGKTPLSDAVRLAAKELKYTEDKATVILISDGKETCEANPCELGKSLSDLGVDFTVHVVGFDIKKEEEKGLQCLAKNTGGVYLPAKNAQQLNKALKQAVKKVKVKAQPVPKQKGPAKPGHLFEAVLKKDGKVITRGLRWDIYTEKKEALENKLKQVTGTYNARPNFKLNAGEYTVIVKYGNAIKRSTFEVKSASESVKYTIVLDAGSVLLKAALDEESAILKKGMRWDVYAAKKDFEGKRKHFGGTYNATPVFHLNTGKYLIVAKRGYASASQEIEIAAGDRKEQLFGLNAGLAFFNAKFSETGPEVEKGMRWDIYSTTKNLEGKRKHFGGTYNTKPNFTLHTGKYLIVSKRGNAVTNQEIEIKPAERTNTTFNLNAGLFVPTAVLKPGEDIEKKGMRWDVYSGKKGSDGKRAHITGTYNAVPTFTLSEGPFHLIAKNGNASAAFDFEIKAGERQEKTYDLNAGRVKLIAVDKSGNKIAKGLRWDIYLNNNDKPGKQITGTYNATPIFTLNTGSYLAQVKIGNAVQQTKLDITQGMSQQIDVVIE